MSAKSQKAIFWEIYTQIPTLLLVCLCSLPDFYCIVYHEVHEFIEALCLFLACSTLSVCQVIYPNLALYSDSQLLKQPYGHS